MAVEAVAFCEGLFGSEAFEDPVGEEGSELEAGGFDTFDNLFVEDVIGCTVSVCGDREYDGYVELGELLNGFFIEVAEVLLDLSGFGYGWLFLEVGAEEALGDDHGWVVLFENFFRVHARYVLVECFEGIMLSMFEIFLDPFAVFLGADNGFLTNVGSDAVDTAKKRLHKNGATAAEWVVEEACRDVFAHSFAEADHDLSEFWRKHSRLVVTVGLVVVAFGIESEVLGGYAIGTVEFPLYHRKIELYSFANNIFREGDGTLDVGVGFVEISAHVS